MAAAAAPPPGGGGDDPWGPPKDKRTIGHYLIEGDSEDEDYTLPERIVGEEPVLKVYLKAEKDSRLKKGTPKPKFQGAFVAQSISYSLRLKKIKPAIVKDLRSLSGDELDAAWEEMAVSKTRFTTTQEVSYTRQFDLHHVIWGAADTTPRIACYIDTLESQHAKDVPSAKFVRHLVIIVTPDQRVLSYTQTY
ncbi:hypothetical protein FGADI_3662 [Fusarium gaditjirri]|uniref:Uncharacterized protein n=1 Tax=Fusarium gaditjirri TaxID=282569 RepID=A0A8H4WZL5_9HYPO|nr:hypothetical protein FGADI_3662 [Fusarium gaditjirri]